MRRHHSRLSPATTLRPRGGHGSLFMNMARSPRYGRAIGAAVVTCAMLVPALAGGVRAETLPPETVAPKPAAIVAPAGPEHRRVRFARNRNRRATPEATAAAGAPEVSDAPAAADASAAVLQDVGGQAVAAVDRIVGMPAATATSTPAADLTATAAAMEATRAAEAAATREAATRAADATRAANATAAAAATAQAAAMADAVATARANALVEGMTMAGATATAEAAVAAATATAATQATAQAEATAAAEATRQADATAAAATVQAEATRSAAATAFARETAAAAATANAAATAQAQAAASATAAARATQAALDAAATATALALPRTTRSGVVDAVSPHAVAVRVSDRSGPPVTYQVAADATITRNETPAALAALAPGDTVDVRLDAASRARIVTAKAGPSPALRAIQAWWWTGFAPLFLLGLLARAKTREPFLLMAAPADGSEKRRGDAR